MRPSPEMGSSSCFAPPGLCDADLTTRGLGAGLGYAGRGKLGDEGSAHVARSSSLIGKDFPRHKQPFAYALEGSPIN